MKITFENVMEKVVNSRTKSRQDKLNDLRKFLKENSGVNKPSAKEEIEILESLKSIKQQYTMKDTIERGHDKN